MRALPLPFLVLMAFCFFACGSEDSRRVVEMIPELAEGNPDSVIPETGSIRRDVKLTSKDYFAPVSEIRFIRVGRHTSIGAVSNWVDSRSIPSESPVVLWVSEVSKLMFPEKYGVDSTCVIELFDAESGDPVTPGPEWGWVENEVPTILGPMGRGGGFDFSFRFTYFRWRLVFPSHLKGREVRLVAQVTNSSGFESCDAAEFVILE